MRVFFLDKVIGLLLCSFCEPWSQSISNLTMKILTPSVVLKNQWPNCTFYQCILVWHKKNVAMFTFIIRCRQDGEEGYKQHWNIASRDKYCISNAIYFNSKSVIKQTLYGKTNILLTFYQYIQHRSYKLSL